MMKHKLLILFFLVFNVLAFSQKNSALLDSVLKSNKLLNSVIQQKAKYRPQIIYTQINRDADGRPVFKNHSYLLDSSNYFYCASLVKLPCSVFALEKINALNQPGLTRSSTMLTDSAGPCQQRYHTDTSALSGLPSLENHIKRMLLVSDNTSYSRVFEFLTGNYIQNRLNSLGHPSARIVHRFDVPCIGKGNRYFNPVRFVNQQGQTIFYQPADSLLTDLVMPFKNLVLGRNIYNKKKRLISSAKDFSKSNYLSLQMIHTFLRDLIFNDYLPKEKQFKITQNDHDFLMKHLGMYPRESSRPRYNPEVFYDSFKKYFIYGSSTPVITNDTLRIYNIVGRAYGFVSDCAYVVDVRNGTEFMLSAVIYTNKRNSFGSGNYEYETVGLPFLKELSLALYQLERNRKKKHLPDAKKINFLQGDR